MGQNECREMVVTAGGEFAGAPVEVKHDGGESQLSNKREQPRINTKVRQRELLNILHRTANASHLDRQLSTGDNRKYHTFTT